VILQRLAPDRPPGTDFVVVESADVVQIDATKGSAFLVTLGVNGTLRIDQGTSGQRIVLRVKQDTVGSRTLTPLPSIVFLNGETGFNIATAVNAATDLEFEFIDDGGNDGYGTWACVTPLTKTRGDALYATPASVAAVAADLAALDASLGTAAFADTGDFDAAGDASTAQTNAQNYADTKIAAIPNQQTFSGAILSASISGGQYIVGDGTNGIPARNAQPLTVLVAQAQVALALLTSVTIKVVNFTQNTSASVTITAGETYHRAAINLAKAVNDEIGLQVDSVTGAPSAGIFNVFAL
jgi:hypothetical protein